MTTKVGDVVIVKNDERNRGRWQLELLFIFSLVKTGLSETMSPAAFSRNRLSKEIETYVSFPVVDRDDDLLCWWKLNDLV